VKTLLLVLWFVVTALATWPYGLQDHPHWQNLQWWPFGPGIVRPIDVLVNVLLYMPLGALMADRKRGVVATALVAVTIACSFELAQVWSHFRIPALLDAVANTSGALLGLLIRQRRDATSRALPREGNLPARE
jgi:VanZ family protein